jgi:hypothetical protein
MNTSKTTKLALIATATVAATIALPATADAAGSDYTFQSPSGNIECWIYRTDAGTAGAGCDVGAVTYVPPTPHPGDQTPRPCYGGIIRFTLTAAGTAGYCQDISDLHRPGIPTLGYGQTRSVGTITCDSEPTGVTCTDSSSGHFFRVSRGSYELG